MNLRINADTSSSPVAKRTPPASAERPRVPGSRFLLRDETRQLQTRSFTELTCGGNKKTHYTSSDYASSQRSDSTVTETLGFPFSRPYLAGPPPFLPRPQRRPRGETASWELCSLRRTREFQGRPWPGWSLLGKRHTGRNAPPGGGVSRVVMSLCSTGSSPRRANRKDAHVTCLQSNSRRVGPCVTFRDWV